MHIFYIILRQIEKKHHKT